MKTVVIGGANIDITGRATRPIRMADSNPASVYLSAGGVARNIAENLFRLGVEVSFISAVGEDSFANVLRGFFAEIGMTSRLLVRKGLHTDLYLDLLEPSGDLCLGINDMQAVESLGPSDVAAFAHLLALPDLVVVDANLRADTLDALAEHASRAETPLMADSVSSAKAERLGPILGRLTLLKTNRAEAEILAGFPLDGEKALREGCAILLDKGIQELHITLGAAGSCSASAEGIVFQPALPGNKVNVNGAGDAFAAGAACRRGLGGNAAQNGLFGAACAAITLESKNAVNRALTRAEAEKRIAPYADAMKEQR